MIAWASLVIAFSGFVAVVATTLARKAARAADATVELTREELAMSRAEHTEFLRELRARARFDVTRTPLAPADAEVVSEDSAASVTRATVAVGISNQRGEKAAGPNSHQCPRSEGTERFRWSGQRGQELPDVSRG